MPKELVLEFRRQGEVQHRQQAIAIASDAGSRRCPTELGRVVTDDMANDENVVDAEARRNVLEGESGESRRSIEVGSETEGVAPLVPWGLGGLVREMDDPDPTVEAGFLNNLGNVMNAKGEYEEGERIFRRAAAIYESDWHRWRGLHATDVFANPLFSKLPHLLVSPGKGLLVYTPHAAVALVAGLFYLGLFPQDRWLFFIAFTPYLAFVTYKMTGKDGQYFWFVAAFVSMMIIAAGPGSSRPTVRLARTWRRSTRRSNDSKPHSDLDASASTLFTAQPSPTPSLSSSSA